ncbi:MAG: sigma 54-interacting transcriptional regulator [bacterium]|jgi:transcriptional regulator of aroF, aroG, tyrA and aromatic amino acid transport
MVLDVLRVLSQEGANIITMEVAPGVINVKFTGVDAAGALRLEESLRSLPDIYGLREIEVLPHEERERQLKAVLDSVSEGIIAVDKRGMITTLNPVAEQILQVNRQKAIGQHLANVVPADVPMLRILETGQGYNNKEIILATKRGRSHYITTGRAIKDERGETVGAVAALKDMSEVRELVFSLTRPPVITFSDIIYASGAMGRVVEMAKMVARGNSTILIRGESGTGKELFARAIHTAGPRRRRPFVALNCAALPDALVESELFGYEEGAFTGAKRGGKQGLFELAHQGTIFLDEIGELSPHLQVKLLRVLQENKVRRVGGREEIPVDVRVIAATNRNLEEMVRKGDFREELYYRLNVIPLYIPPLRDRMEDLPVLVENCLQKFNRVLKKKVKRIHPQVLERFRRHSWPGNVRELENVLERAMNLVEGDEIRPEHIFIEDLTTPGFGFHQIAGHSLKELKEQLEREVISRMLAKYGAARPAARALGISHTALLRKIKKYNLRSLLET